MANFENPAQDGRPEPEDKNGLFRGSDTRTREREGNVEISREAAREELVESCRIIEERFHSLERMGLVSLEPELAEGIRLQNQSVCRAIEAYRTGTLEILSQCSQEELDRIQQMISDFSRKMIQRADEADERIERERKKIAL